MSWVTQKVSALGSLGLSPILGVEKRNFKEKSKANSIRRLLKIYFNRFIGNIVGVLCMIVCKAPSLLIVGHRLNLVMEAKESLRRSIVPNPFVHPGRKNSLTLAQKIEVPSKK